MNRVARLLIAKGIIAVFIGIVFLSATPRLGAIPAFARKYKTACATCHNNWPELNDFGRAFKASGFRFPKDDDQFVKDPPLMLGAEAQKETFPYSIYPGELPNIPLAFRYSGYLTYNNTPPAAITAANGYSPNTTLFSPNTVTMIAAGNFGPAFSFWIDDDLSAAGSGGQGGLGDGYIKANLGSLFHAAPGALSVRYGQFELDLPFTDARTINLSGYAIYDETATASVGTTNNPLALSSPQDGIEVGGYPHNGNTWWNVAVVDGENSVYGTGTATTGHNSKDVYVHVAQRFNLERDASVRKEIQASGPTGVRDHHSLRLDGFAYYGRNELNQDGKLLPGLPLFHEAFYRAGGAFDYKLHNRFELYGLYEHGHDENKILNGDGTALVSATPVTFSGGFLEAEFWAYPWLIATMRYDGVNSPTDFQNGVSRHDTRGSYVPGLYFLVRPNIKLEMEYTYNFEQPVPGTTTFYRANTLATGADFVF